MTELFTQQEIWTTPPNKYKFKQGLGVHHKVLAGGSTFRYVVSFVDRYTKKRSLKVIGSVDDISQEQAREIANKALSAGVFGKTLKSFLNVLDEIADSKEWLPKTRTDTVAMITARFPTLVHQSPAQWVKNRYQVAEVIKEERQTSVTMADKIEKIIERVIARSLVIGLVDMNPYQDVTKERQRIESERHPQMPVERVPEFYNAILSSGLSNDKKNALALCILTGLRTNNVLGLKWSQIESEAIVIPKEQDKAKRGFRIPITQTLNKIIKEQRATKLLDSEYVFNSNRGMRYTGSQLTIWLDRAKLSYEYGSVAHGLRGVVMSGLLGARYDERLVKMQVGHQADTGSTRFYNQSDLLQERKQMMEHWDDYVIGLTSTIDQLDT